MASQAVGGANAAGEVASKEQRDFVSAKFAGVKCSEYQGCSHDSPALSGIMLEHEPGDAVANAVDLARSQTPYALPPPLALQDVHARAKAAPATFKVPALKKCQTLHVGDMAEVMFTGDASVGPGEYLWVQVVEAKDGAYVGLVTHLVFMLAHPNTHELVRFEAKHVANIIKASSRHR
jgi:hypothetical protein